MTRGALDPAERAVDIVESTAKYESWLARHTALVPDDLEVKHDSMRESVAHFFRATYHRWCQVWPTACATAAKAPRVVAVGDLHVDAFGVWRDSEARLVWGVYELGEAGRLPFTHDLIRLGVSVKLAIDGGEISLEPENALAVLLDGYRAALESGGDPLVLGERQEHLAALVHERTRAAGRFWRAVEGAVLVARADVPAAPRAALHRALPRDTQIIGFGHRLGAVGNLGRPSFVVWGSWRGSLVGREASLVAPPTAAWTTRNTRPVAELVGTLRSAPARADDPSIVVAPDGWLVRRVAPDCARLDLASLPSGRHDARLLGAMAFEAANLHMATRSGAELLVALDALPPHWLRECVTVMEESIRGDWVAWCGSRRNSGLRA